MSIQNALAKLRARSMKFSTLQIALEHNKLPKSNRWDNLERKFDALEIPAKTRAAHVSDLERIYRDNIDWGDKAIQIAKFDKSVSRLFAFVAAHLFVTEFKPSSPFPDPVSEQDIAGLTLQPVLVAINKEASPLGTTLYFYSRAYETEREVFPVDDMTDAVSLKRFAGFDEVVAYRRIIFHRIDSVFINTQSRLIEFRADATRLKTTDRMVEALIELKKAFRSLLERQVDAEWGQIEFPLVNFFPKIAKMYDDRSGTLVQLGHNTEAGAINHGKMRGLRGDLKKDPSHVASMIGFVTEKFAIQKAYSYYNKLSVVHLSIPGKSADAALLTPAVVTAIVTDCIDATQFDDMMRILR